MLTSKFDLYKSEWLDLVFAGRNKAYGAYELRQNYDRTVAKALGYTFMSIALLLGAALLSSHPAAVVPSIPSDPTITVTLQQHVDNHPAAPKKAPQLPKPVAPVKTTAFVPLVVKPDPEIKTPAPDVTKIQGAIGPVTIDAPGTAPNAPVDNKGGTGTGGPQPPPDNTVYQPVGLEFMPTPVGGEAAWNKFLTKNLRFPAEAQDANIGGKVYVSFIIEKDGTLTDITVVRGAGYGMDEEAARVLKLAKPWKPGVQNGQPVRVKFVIPINFQIGEQP